MERKVYRLTQVESADCGNGQRPCAYARLAYEYVPPFTHGLYIAPDQIVPEQWKILYKSFPADFFAKIRNYGVPLHRISS